MLCMWYQSKLIGVYAMNNEHNETLFPSEGKGHDDDDNAMNTS